MKKLVSMIRDLEEIKGIEKNHRKYNKQKSRQRHYKSQVRNLTPQALIRINRE